jgi:hypothetical protein
MTTMVSSSDKPHVATTPHADELQGAPPAGTGQPKKMGLLRIIASQFSPRRQYVINREKQLRSAFLVVVVVVLLLVPLNYSLHTVRQQEMPPSRRPTPSFARSWNQGTASSSSWAWWPPW